jgi:hypothetical protein
MKPPSSANPLSQGTRPVVSPVSGLVSNDALSIELVIEIPRQFSKYTYVRTLGCTTSSVVILAAGGGRASHTAQEAALEYDKLVTAKIEEERRFGS